MWQMVFTHISIEGWIIDPYVQSTAVGQLAATKDAKIKLKTYNCTTTTQLGRYKVKIENNNKCKTCIFFVFLGDREALLGMPVIELLYIVNINSTHCMCRER